MLTLQAVTDVSQYVILAYTFPLQAPNLYNNVVYSLVHFMLIVHNCKNKH